MDYRSILARLINKKTLAVIISVYLIPQAIYLALKLAWGVFVTFIMFLIVYIGLIIGIKTCFPQKVNVSDVFEWTLHSSLQIGSRCFNMLRHLVHSVFDNVYGKELQSKEKKSSRDRQTSSR